MQFPGMVGLLAAIPLVLTAPLVVQDEGLPQRVTTLETQVAALTEQLAALKRGKSVTVDCGAGETIQAALASLQTHPAPVGIVVFGVCTENIVVTRSLVQIRAGAPGAGITAANQLRPVIQSGLGAVNGIVLLLDLTIGGGRDGVLVEFGTHVRLVNCLVKDNQTGVRVLHKGSGRLDNTVVEHNAGAGIAASDSSHVFVSGGFIRHNGNGVELSSGATAEVGGSATIISNTGNGLALNGNATAEVGDSATIASSGVRGVSLAGGSLLSLSAATITGSTLTGIFASGGSTVVLEKSATITANMLSGISLMDTSLVQKRRGEADIHITNNGGWGIVCSVSPAVAQIVGFTFETGNISGNGSGAINCLISPGPLAQ